MICPRYNACINTGAFVPFVYGTMHAIDTNGYTSGIMLLFPSFCVRYLSVVYTPNKFFRGFNNTVHVTKAQIHAWLEQIQKFKDLILFLKTLQFTFENGLNYTTKQIDKKTAFNE